MCGIVALCYETDNPRLGAEAGDLLKRLEYRGYDSTGGAFVGTDRSITAVPSTGKRSLDVAEPMRDPLPPAASTAQAR